MKVYKYAAAVDVLLKKLKTFERRRDDHLRRIEESPNMKETFEGGVERYTKLIKGYQDAVDVLLKEG